MALELEVVGLSISVAEWLELLYLRTSGMTKDKAQSGKELVIANSAEALSYIWESSSIKRKFKSRLNNF